jgi:hypothetical protein
MVAYHGPHCRIRSFPTKCRKCNASVLYWECAHGVKTFLNYPIYGKPIRHRCNHNSSSKSKVIKGFDEILLNSLHKNRYQCPVCAKIFETQTDLNHHISVQKKQDDAHALYFGSILNKLEFDNVSERQEKFEITNLEQNPLNSSRNSSQIEEKKINLTPKIYLKENLSKNQISHQLLPFNPNFYTIKDSSKKKKS